ncbi:MULTISPECIES: FadR/GntR family transcriptional regulator [Amycolatopsis]|uniref:FadR/GntR family transcriptional regulator n=1 Tax=Amycolatopsis TaxID=1813 RepID=UPI000B8B5F87|nr:MULTISPECIES: FCD domain-containing protein [Amycolatopsis]OXM63579.1 GntR family transcriptional regulator [Amycolatopsis sp. KNN50.9b]
MTNLTGLGRTRAEQLAALLEERIRGLAPGDPVGTIDEIRRESGLARATVSEAIRLLRDRGVLAIRPGRGGGLFVADQGPVVRMRHTLLGVREDPSSVADAVELRNHLEELIDVGAARCRTAEDIPRLRARLDAMAAAPGWEEFVRANWALHEEIAALCPNAMARAVYLGTLGHLSTTAPHLRDTDAGAYRARRLRVHVDLVDAIASGDEAAVRAAVARHNTTD